MTKIVTIIMTILGLLLMLILLLGMIPMLIISAIIEFVFPAIIAELVLLNMLLLRFNIKKLFCFLGFSLLSVLCYLAFVTDYSLFGIDRLEKALLYGPLFALAALVFLLLFFIFDNKIKHEEKNSKFNSEKTTVDLIEK